MPWQLILLWLALAGFFLLLVAGRRALAPRDMREPEGFDPRPRPDRVKPGWRSPK